MSNKCSPKNDCNVCKECCQDYIENGEECDKCFEENCQNNCDTSVKDVDVEVDEDGNPIDIGPAFIESNCNVCPDCCQDYIKNGNSCNSCVKDKCDPNNKQFNKGEGLPLFIDDNEDPSYLWYYLFISYTIFTFIVFLYYHKLFLSLSNFTRVSYFIILIWLILLLIVSISSLKPLCDSLNYNWNPIQGSFREKYCKYKFSTQSYLVILTAIISLILLFLVIFDIISIYDRSTFLFIVIVINLVMTMGINLSVANHFTFQFM
tara:strand:- start:2571 stop:3356 length:786 start_codon:yes stop_codon:yes gene_type:complete